MRDVDIRKALKSSILRKFYADKDSKVVNELPVGYTDAIIDIAVINGHLHGFEIKSDFDTLKRLSSQLPAYITTFDYLTFIAGSRHINRLIQILPDWCGIIQVNSETLQLSYVRKSKRNKHITNYSVAQLLWREEAIDILNEIGVIKGINSKPKPFLWQLLSTTLNKKELSYKVRQRLKIRTNWKSDLSSMKVVGIDFLN